MEAALDYAHDNDQSRASDSDEDMLEFVNADVEEVEDNLVRQYRRSMRPLKQAEINRYSNRVDMS